MATNRTTKPALLRVRVPTDDDAIRIRAFCRDFGLRCIIDIDPTKSEDTTALDDALSPPKRRPIARTSRKKGET